MGRVPVAVLNEHICGVTLEQDNVADMKVLSDDSLVIPLHQLSGKLNWQLPLYFALGTISSLCALGYDLGTALVSVKTFDSENGCWVNSSGDLRRYMESDIALAFSGIGIVSTLCCIVGLFMFGSRQLGSFGMLMRCLWFWVTRMKFLTTVLAMQIVFAGGTVVWYHGFVITGGAVTWVVIDILTTTTLSCFPSRASRKQPIYILCKWTVRAFVLTSAAYSTVAYVVIKVRQAACLGTGDDAAFTTAFFPLWFTSSKVTTYLWNNFLAVLTITSVLRIGVAMYCKYWWPWTLAVEFSRNLHHPRPEHDKYTLAEEEARARARGRGGAVLKQPRRRLALTVITRPYDTEMTSIMAQHTSASSTLIKDPPSEQQEVQEQKQHQKQHQGQYQAPRKVSDTTNINMLAVPAHRDRRSSASQQMEKGKGDDNAYVQL